LATKFYIEILFTALNSSKLVLKLQKNIPSTVTIKLEQNSYLEQKQALQTSIEELSAVHDFEQAIPCFYEIIALAESNNDLETAKEYSIQVGKLLINFEYCQEAIPYLQKAISLFNANEISRDLAIVYSNISRAYFHVKQYDEAVDASFKSINIKIQMNDDKGLAYSFMLLGMIYDEKKDYQESFKYYHKSLEYTHKSKDSSLKAQLLHNLGTLSYKFDNVKRAIEYFKESLEICKNESIIEGYSNGVKNLVEVYRDLKRFQEIEALLDEAISLTSKLEDKRYLAGVLHSKATTLYSLKRYEQALLIADEANVLLKKLPVYTQKISNNLLIAFLYFELKEFDKTEATLEETYLLLDVEDYPIMRLQGYKLHSQLLELQGNFKDALVYFKRYDEIQIETESKEKNTKLQSMVMQLDLANVKMSEQQLSNERMKQILDSALDGVISMDQAGNVTTWNPQAEVIFGWTSEEVLGNKLSEYIIPPEYRNAHEKGLQRFMTTGEYKVLHSRIEITAIRKDGVVIPVELTILPIKTENTYSFSAFIRDISEQKQAEELLKNYNQSLREEVSKQTQELAEKNDELLIANRETERLLDTILPKSISHRLKNGEKLIAEKFPHTTILFADLAGFTEYAKSSDPVKIVQLLSTIFTEFDTIAERYGLEKIKTIGDAYMVASGVPEYQEHHAYLITKFAIDCSQWFIGFKELNGLNLQMRIGIHTGETVAGVIGTKKIAYDVWGDVVNTASRMESHGSPGKIHISKEMKSALEPYEGEFEFVSRGMIYIKGKGEMETFFVDSALY